MLTSSQIPETFITVKNTYHEIKILYAGVCNLPGKPTSNLFWFQDLPLNLVILRLQKRQFDINLNIEGCS